MLRWLILLVSAALLGFFYSYDGVMKTYLVDRSSSSESFEVTLKQVQPPQHATLQPSHATLQPSHATLQPSHATLQPSHATLQPSHATLQPSHATLQPSHATLQPSHATLQPSPNATLQPSHATLQPSPNATLQPSPNATLQPPLYAKVQDYLDCVTSPRGRWVQHEANFTLPVWVHSNPPSRFCPNIRLPLNFSQSSRPGNYFYWQPPEEENCKLEHFSRARFCQVFRGRTLYSIGDSISRSFYMNLRYLFGNFYYYADEAAMAPYLPTHDSWSRLKCDNVSGDVMLKYVHNLQLEQIPGRNRSFDRDAIFVFNSGAHFRDTPVLLRSIRKFLTALRKQHPDGVFIWRTSPRGHDVGTYPGEIPFASALPLKVPPPPLNVSTIALREPRYFTRNYGWHLFAEQSQAVRELLRREFPGVYFLNVDHMDLLRIDGRIDGLHSCNPGMHMEWSRLVMNLVAQL